MINKRIPRISQLRIATADPKDLFCIKINLTTSQLMNVQVGKFLVRDYLCTLYRVMVDNPFVLQLFYIHLNSKAADA
jgi:hypothetical protein